jgi:hypothetical protein
MELNTIICLNLRQRSLSDLIYPKHDLLRLLSSSFTAASFQSIFTQSHFYSSILSFDQLTSSFCIPEVFAKAQTVMPCSTSSLQIAMPTAEEAPVTMPTRPCHLYMFSLGVSGEVTEEKALELERLKGKVAILLVE